MSEFFGQSTSEGQDSRDNRILDRINELSLEVTAIRDFVATIFTYPFNSNNFPANMNATTPYASSAVVAQSLLEWTNIPPEGTVNGQISHWYEDAGEAGTGAWVNTSAPTNGDLLYWDEEGGAYPTWSSLGIGTSGQVLKTSATGLPEWDDLEDELPTGDTGDILIYNSGWKAQSVGNAGTVPASRSLYVLQKNGTSYDWTEVEALPSSSMAIGDLATWDGSNYVRFAKGSAGSMLTTGATALEWATAPAAAGDMYQWQSGGWTPINIKTAYINYGSGGAYVLVDAGQEGEAE